MIESNARAFELSGHPHVWLAAHKSTMVMFYTRSLWLVACLHLAAAFSSRSFGQRRSSVSLSATTVAAPTSTIAFSKYQGLGNDFILIDNRSQTEPSLTPEQSARLCDRNFGIGGDGVIFALSPTSDDFDFAMRIYNSDGSEPEMCGNGIRCMAKYLQDLGESSTTYRIQTLAGPIVPVMNDDGTVTVDMGEPILEAAKVPTTLEPNAEFDSVVEQTYTLSGKTWKITAVSMGNPHAVIFVNNLDTDIDFTVDGPALEAADVFPAKTNVEFVEVLSENHLKMKVWERGAGPTLACGTGACALVVAAVRAGKIPRQPTTVTLPGGDLSIDWRESDNKVYMTGPATFAFEGNAVL